jgi:hypothetical protein
VLRDLDQWLRRPLRAIAWKQWKYGRNRFVELRRRGLGWGPGDDHCRQPPWPWRLSNSPALALALPNFFLTSLGLPYLATVMPSNPPNRRIRTRTYGGVGGEGSPYPVAEPQPSNGYLCWQGDDAARVAVHGNRNRLRSGVGKEAMRKRGEVVERSFAHVLDRVGIRRTWLWGRENVHKRYLVHVAGYNLGILMSALLGAGTPKDLAGFTNAFRIRHSPAGDRHCGC